MEYYSVLFERLIGIEKMNVFLNYPVRAHYVRLGAGVKLYGSLIK